jgi:acetoin utilization protein AcuB
MLVKDWMSTVVITIDHGASLHDAIKLLELNDIRMLPVMNGEELVGVITETHFKS